MRTLLPASGSPRTPAGAARLATLLSAIACAATLAACSDAETTAGDGPDATGQADEWTMLGQDLASTYHNAAERQISVDTAPRLREAWTLEARGAITGAPAVKSGALYVVSAGGTYAFDGATGAERWQNPGVRGTSSPTLSEGVLFVNDSASVLHALDATTGAERWSAVIDPHPFASGVSSPVAFEGRVIVGSASGEEGSPNPNATFRGSVVAFGRETGTELWRFYTAEPPCNGAAVWSTVSIDPEMRLVFASTGNNYTGEAGPTSDAILALDVDTGELVWLRQLTEGDVFTMLHLESPDADFGANPILFEAGRGGRRRKLVGAGQKSGVFWALDRATGEVIWSRAVSPGSALIGGMLNNGAFDGERILVAGATCRDARGEPTKLLCTPATTSALMALDPADGSTLWERQLPSWVWAPITVANGVGFVAIDNVLRAFDAATGATLLELPTGGTIASAPSVAAGRVHFGSGMSYFVGTPGRTLHVLSIDGVGGGGGGGGGGPTYAPTFPAIYDEIIAGKGCNTASCHGSNQGNLSLSSPEEAYASLVDAPAAGALCASSGLVRVVPGDPSASLLLDKVSSATPACGGPMPPAAPLSAREVEQIRAWIERGAPPDAE